MVKSYKPEGYNSVSPYLVVSGAEQTIAFLKKTFDAEELRRYAAEDGRLTHAEVRIDDTVIMLADGSANWQPQAYSVHIYVPDVDAVYRKAMRKRRPHPLWPRYICLIPCIPLCRNLMRCLLFYRFSWPTFGAKQIW